MPDIVHAAVRGPRGWRVARLALPAALIVLALLMNAALVPATLQRLHGDRYDDFTLVYRSTKGALDGLGLASGPKSTGESNLNSPAFHLVMLPVAMLPAPLAPLAWVALLALSLAASLRVVATTLGGLGTEGWLWLAFVLLVFPGAYTVLVSGGIAFVLVLPMTLAWREARTGRWCRAGAWIGGVVAIKLFAGVFLVYLGVRRKWRALGCAVLTLVLLSAAGASAFGIGAYEQWSRTLAGVAWEAGLANGSLRGSMARAVDLGAAAPLTAGISWLAAAIGVVILSVSALARHAGDANRSFALLLLVALLLSPLGWVHYLVLVTGPIVALVRGTPAAGAPGPPLSPGGLRHGPTRLLAILALVTLALPYPVLYHAATAAPRSFQWLLSSASTWGLLAAWAAIIALPNGVKQGGPV